MLQMVNMLHCGFGRALPAPLQLLCAERVLNALNLENVLLDRVLVWQVGGVEVGVRDNLPERNTPRGFQVTTIGNT